MTRNLHNLDSDALEDLDYEPWLSNRERHQQRQRRVHNKEIDRDHVKDLAEPLDLEAGFQPTYRPSRYERGWLLDSLRPLYEDSLITDVLSLVQGGKEANVYCCRAHPATGKEILAAKVYRPRMFRNLRNDKQYRQGRQILTEGGRPINARDQRIIRAIGKKTDFGVQVEHTSWLMHEYATLQRLHQAGGDVPQPLAAHDNALIMDYFGVPHRAAPLLQNIRVPMTQAPELLDRILKNVEIMLSHHMIHGDLSAYNILYWEGGIILIDFPQVVNSQTNPDARELLVRDVTRVCEYFAHNGVEASAEELVEDLWYRYGKDALSPEEALGERYLGPMDEDSLI